MESLKIRTHILVSTIHVLQVTTIVLIMFSDFGLCKWVWSKMLLLYGTEFFPVIFCRRRGTGVCSVNRLWRHYARAVLGPMQGLQHPLSATPDREGRVMFPVTTEMDVDPPSCFEVQFFLLICDSQTKTNL